MPKPPSSAIPSTRTKWQILHGLVVFESAITLAYLLLDISDETNRFFLWYSPFRTASIVLFLFILAATGYVLFSRRTGERIVDFLDDKVSEYGSFRFMFWSTLLVIVLLLGIRSVPPGLLDPELQVRLDRFTPIIFYFLVLALEYLITIYIGRQGIKLTERVSSYLKSVSFKVSMAAILLFGIVAVTRVGNQPDPMVWRQMGSPLLIWQIAVSILLGVIVWVLEKKIPANHRKLMNGILVLTLFAAAYFSWMSLPLQKAYTSPGVRPPNNEVYPYADSLLYSLSAESVLSGYGMANWAVVPRPMMIMELVYVFFAAGGDFAGIIQIQTIVLALIPVLMFLIGRELAGKPFGVSLAVLAIFREVDAILSTPHIPVSNSKLILSDLPTLLVLLLLTWLVIRWLKPENHVKHYPALIGGVLGILMLIRTQAVLLLPVFLLLAAIIYWKQKRRWIVKSLIIFGVFIATLSPWLVRNYILTGTVVFDDKTSQTGPLMARYAGFSAEGEEAPDLNAGLLSVVFKSFVSNPGVVLGSIANHFFRNVICTLMVIPPNIQGNSLDYLFQSTNWWSTMQLDLSWPEILALLASVLIMVYGMVKLAQRKGLSGLAPLFLFIGYTFSNAVARNSGGRYNLPVDWVGYFYLAVGLLFVCKKLLAGLFSNRSSVGAFTLIPEKQKPGKSFTFQLMALFLVIGSLIPLTEVFFARISPPENKIQLDTYVQKDARLAGIINDLLADPVNKVVYGKAFYPRYYKEGQGEAGSAWIAYAPHNFNRVGFYVIPQGEYLGVLFPTIKPTPYFPNRSEVILIGEYYSGWVKKNQETYFIPRLILLANTDPVVYYTWVGY